VPHSCRRSPPRSRRQLASYHLRRAQLCDFGLCTNVGLAHFCDGIGRSDLCRCCARRASLHTNMLDCREVVLQLQPAGYVFQRQSRAEAADRTNSPPGGDSPQLKTLARALFERARKLHMLESISRLVWKSTAPPNVNSLAATARNFLRIHPSSWRA